MKKTIILVRGIVGFIILIFLFIENYQLGLLGLLIFLRTRDQNEMVQNGFKEIIKHLQKKK